MKNEILNFKNDFKDLLMAASPSGKEIKAVEVWERLMNRIVEREPIYKDKIGNSAYCMGEGDIRLLLSGHIDEVNAMVSNIEDNGTMTIINTGGICKKSLLANHILVINDKDELIKGIVEKKPIHCETNDEKDKVEEISKFKINVGAENKEEVENLGIHPGSRVIYERNSNMNFGKNQICSQGIDDKVGVFITYLIFKELSETPATALWRNKYSVIGLAATQEETGLRGAKVAAKNINPDISIDFDVTFATDGNDMNKGRYGDIKLGEGGVIQYGADKSERLNSILVNTAKDNSIKFQYGATGAGGTNTNAIQLMSKDCETTLISIPNRNMHTPVEIVDWRDIESIVDMVVSAIKNCEI